jgi:hypothetical protein
VVLALVLFRVLMPQVVVVVVQAWLVELVSQLAVLLQAHRGPLLLEALEETELHLA